MSQGSIVPTRSGADLVIARGRIGLAVIAPLSIYIDPSNNGWFNITSYSLATLSCYLVYSGLAYGWVTKRSAPPSQVFLSITAILDVVFAAGVALATEGPTSPSWLFFVFAIFAANLRTGFRAGTFITLCCSTIYLVLLIIAAPGRQFEMRAAYLAIVGYLILFFGQENIRLEGTIRDLEDEQQRREIARTLHDGYIQALASVNLQLDTCGKLLKSERPADALLLVEYIQAEVKREYDEVRAFVRALARIAGPVTPKRDSPAVETYFDITASFKSHGLIPEQVFQILIEGMRNIRAHAAANLARVSVTQVDHKIHIAIDDDGVGLTQAQNKPWSIASRVDEYGGSLEIESNPNRGTHLKIELAAE